MGRRRARSKKRKHAEPELLPPPRAWRDWLRLARAHHATPDPVWPALLAYGVLAAAAVSVSVQFEFDTLSRAVIALAAVHLTCKIALGGYTRRLPVPLGDGDVDAVCPSKRKGPLRCILVTGGCGFLGWTVTQHLVEWAAADGRGCSSSSSSRGRIRIVVVDLTPPHPSRRVRGVEYIAADLARDDLTGILDKADAVIHTAGLVDLTADAARTYNAHVVATARLIAAARISKSCRFLVGTSSVGAVTSPHVNVTGRSQLNLPADFVPPEMKGGRQPSAYPFFCAYSSTKFFAERMLLAANEPAEHNFRTMAIRLPMIFGLQDPMVVAPLFKGQRGHVPDGKGALVQFVYVENAAEMHVHALLALCGEEATMAQNITAKISGRVFNVTNGDAPRDSIETWNVLVSRANQRLGLSLPLMQPVPFALMYGIASVIEGLFAVCCGHVPFRRNPVWNLTRAALSHSCTPATQSMKATIEDLGYTPRFTTEQAFDDMIREKKFEMKMMMMKAEEEKKKVKKKSAVARANPLDQIAWPLTVPAQNMFDRMSGPGMTGLEAAVTGLAMAGGMCYAWRMQNPAWSSYQLAMSQFFALINASAVVQCTTPTSKRWYHEGGRLSNRLAFVIAAEVVVLVLCLHGTFADGATAGRAFFCMEGVLSLDALCEAGGLVGAVLLTHFSPLSVQRGVGVLCACAGIAMLQAYPHPPLKGMEWAGQLLFVKYCVSHVPRHEPYL
jgi:nucleoside-diphosphate-sugar epimerase